MCRSCGIIDPYDLHDLFFSFSGRGRNSDPFGFSGDGINRDYFAPVSQRAMNALDKAKRIFLDHLATVDTSNGEVTTEIIKFHLVPDMRKAFNRFVKEYGCTGTSRQITRAEQDLVNKTRKSLLWYTSVKVTPEAQRAYLEKNPSAAAKHAAARTQSQAPVAGGSASASASSNSTAAATQGPLREISDVNLQKTKHKLNEAAVKHAATNPSIKKLNSHKKV